MGPAIRLTCVVMGLPSLALRTTKGDELPRNGPGPSAHSSYSSSSNRDVQ